MTAYQCGKCEEIFEKRSEAKKHISLEHPEQPSSIMEVSVSPKTQVNEDSESINEDVVRHPKDPLKGQALGSRQTRISMDEN
jgi:hypothetical protein